MIKKTGIILGAVLILALLVYVSFTGPVDRTPYFESNYYKNSCSQIDSLSEVTHEAKGSLLAGFSKINITPKLDCECCRR